MDQILSLLKIIGVILIMMATTSVALPQSEPDAIEAGKFSAAAPGVSLPDGWKHVTFKKIKKHTRYSLVKEPPMISGIAIMTDSDNTAESTTAFYGDIAFRKRNPDSLKERTSKR